MKLEEAQTWVAKLKAAYPSSKALDEVTGDLFTETVMGMDSRDFAVAFKDMTATLKFFPSLAEMHEAVNFCRSRRIAFEDSQERRNRLALDSVMDPNAEIHASVQGPNHARFLRILRGEEKFQEPVYMKRKKSSNKAAYAGYVPITDAERMTREASLRRQAAELKDGR